MEKLKTTRILAIIGLVGLLLGVITPYVKYSFWTFSYSISLINYWEGVIVLILAIATALFIFQDFIEKYIPSLFDTAFGKKVKELNNPKLALIPIALIAILAIYLTVTLGISTFSYYNVGFYCLWIGAICLVVYAFIHKKDENISQPVNSNVQNYNGQMNNMQNQNPQNYNSQNYSTQNNYYNGQGYNTMNNQQGYSQGQNNNSQNNNF